MFETAYLKIQRASEHIEELNKLIRKERPFTFVLETNTHTRQRTARAKKNEPVIQRCAVICGDAVHNLRSALDHAFFEVVSPHCKLEEINACQFPFSKTLARLNEAVSNRLAPRAGAWLVSALTALKPYGEAGGNELLYLIHELDVTDKHRLLVPAGDYTMLSSDILRSQALDFPRMPGGFVMAIGDHYVKGIAWPLHPHVEASLRGVIPAGGILEQELHVPVQIVFAVGDPASAREFIQTLHLMVDAAKSAIEAIRPI